MSRTEAAGDWRTVAALIATLSVYGITLGLTYPLLSLILEARGVDRSLNGLNAAMPALGMVLASPFIPRTIARLGVRGFIATCIVGEMALLLALPAFPSLPAWFAIRLVLGVTQAGLFIAGESWLNAAVSEGTRGRVMAAYMMVIIAGVSVGPAIVPLVGIAGWAPFLVAAGIVAVAALPLALAVPGALRLDGAGGFRVLAFFRLAPVLCACWLYVSFKESAGAPLLPVYGLRTGLAAGESALMLTVMGAGAFALQLPIGWLGDRFGRRRVMLLAVAGSLAGAVLLPLAGDGWALWALLFAWGGVGSGIVPLALAQLGQRYSGGELVAVNAAFGVLWGLGSIAGPALAGPAMDAWDPHGLPAVMAAGAAGCLLLAALRRRPA